jgi:O-glycosyl hydrolase
MKRKPVIFLLAIVLITICIVVYSNILNNYNNNVIEIKLLTKEIHQTIHNFGASDCWSGQFVGSWPDDQKNRIADLLFSSGTDSIGNPVGIGLSCWRFNIGAGSAEQGDQSNIEDEWRRAPGFLNNDGSYNWQAQASQRWLMQAAKVRGCNQFIAFVNSPPVQFTKNGKAYSSGGSSGNLDYKNYKKYAGFLADVIINIKKLDGIEFDYVSPFNEPEWDWKAGKNGKAGQEGSPWLNHEIKAICTEIDAALSAKNLSTKIEIPETGQLNFLYETGNKPGRSNHIEDFFSPLSHNYVGDLPHMAGKIAGHSYHTTWPYKKLINIREKMAKKIEEVAPELEFWMSEYCILENNVVIKGRKKDPGIAPALYMAMVIHSDLVIENANAWQWWLAISPYDYKDGLVYIEKSKTGGKIETSKMLWALGNFSRFITPDSKRIGILRSDITTASQMDSLLISGYKTREEKYICVLVNLTGNNFRIKVDLDKKNYSEVSGFITSNGKTHNLTRIETGNPGDILIIPARSIITLVFDQPAI